MARRAFVLLLVPYVAWLVLAYDYHFLDGVNLLFHEAGHLFFGFFGRTLHFLGGTIGQMVFPVACAVYFLRDDKRFEAAICGIWGAESLMYVAMYLGDAQAQALPLVGGHIHDWNWLLSRAGLLAWCETIASGIHILASGLAIGLLAVAARESLRPVSEPEAPPELIAQLRSIAEGETPAASPAPAPAPAPSRGGSVFGGPPRSRR